MRDRVLLTGLGLLVVSLLLALVSPSLVRLPEGADFLSEGRLLAFSLVGWLQQVALVLGACLVGAAVVLRRLAPPAGTAAGRAEPGVDWYG